MADEQIIHISGTIGNDVTLTQTQNGKVCNLNVVHNSRRYDQQQGKWVDTNPVWFHCSAWNQLAENAAQCLHKGMRVLAEGVLTQGSYEKNGVKVTTWQVSLTDLAPSLRFDTPQAALQRAQNRANNPAPRQYDQQPMVNGGPIPQQTQPQPQQQDAPAQPAFNGPWNV